MTSYPITFLDENSTVVKVTGQTDIGTVDFNVLYRADDSPDSGGTALMSSDLQATVGMASTGTFVDGGSVDADKWLVLDTSAQSSATELWVTVSVRGEWGGPTGPTGPAAITGSTGPDRTDRSRKHW